MAMEKLYTSVLRCSGSSCTNLPTIQLDAQKRVGGRVLFTAAQDLTCAKHAAEIATSIQIKFPGFYIAQINNPGWLSREQSKLEPLTKGERVPPTAEQLSELQSKFGENRRTRR